MSMPNTRLRSMPTPRSSPIPPRIIDWAPTIRKILADIGSQQPIATVAAKFHNTLVAANVAIAKTGGH